MTKDLPTLLSIANLTKSFGETKVLKSVDLSLNRGDIYALIGPNGSGKTTLIKVIVGLLTADVGSVKLFSHDIQTDPIAAKNSFGYVSDSPVGYDFLTGLEFLSLTANLRGIPPKAAKLKIEELLTLFPISDIVSSPMGHYSRGNIQKVAFLSALLGNPQLLIIDEPIVGLDPESISIFGNRLKQFSSEGGIVLFVTHTLSFAQEFATRFGLLKSGTLVSEGVVRPSLNLESLYQQKVLHG